MKLSKLIDEIEKTYPLQVAEDWDNVGLLLGDVEKEINKILVCLDINSECIDYAISNDIDIIISHHPLIFKPLKRLILEDLKSRKVLRLAKENIAVYCMHTNLDSALNGLNDYVWKLIDINSKAILEDKTFNRPIRYYELDEYKSIYEIIDILKLNLNLKSVRLVHNNYYTNSKVKRIALVTGSGMDFKDEVISSGVDLFITADVKHHEALDALEEGLAIIDIGHYESEIFAIDLIGEFLNEISELEIDVYYSAPTFKTI